MRLRGNGPYRTYLKTRRTARTLALSTAVTLLLLATSQSAYGLPAFTMGRDTPITYLLGPILGCLLATTVTSVTPELEALATGYIRPTRATVTALVALVALTQLATLTVAILLLDAVSATTLTNTHLTTLLTATVFFQGVAVISAILVHGVTMWALPGILTTALVLFGYSPQGHPYPWDLLLIDSGPTRTAAVATVALALTLTRFTNPGILNRAVANTRAG